MYVRMVFFKAKPGKSEKLHTGAYKSARLINLLLKLTTLNLNTLPFTNSQNAPRLPYLEV